MATILLAEDDADIRLLVTHKLTHAGHQVRGFGDGLSAVTDAREHPPDLAVLDIMMPGMSGLEVCRELRKDPATARIPVILLTALARETDISAGLAAGADDYIVKPFSPREFTIRVNAALTRTQAGAGPGVTSPSRAGPGRPLRLGSCYRARPGQRAMATCRWPVPGSPSEAAGIRPCGSYSRPGEFAVTTIGVVM